MANEPSLWRKIESALEHIARDQGQLDRATASGDLWFYTDLNQINLTLLAKDIAKELSQ